MVQTIPNGVKSMGTRRVVFIPGGAADLSAVTLAEVQGADNVSCYLTRAGGFEVGGEQQTITDGRYCSAQDFEIPGTKQKTLMTQYTFNLNEPTEDKARLALAEGTRGTIVHFLQKDEDSDTFADGDWYEAVNVECGEQIVVAVEDNAMDRIRQKLFVQSEWASFKQLGGAGKAGWEITITGTPTGGTFTLSLNGSDTAPIAHNATGANIAAALNALSGVTGVSGITGSGSAGGPHTITLPGAGHLTGDGSGLTGGTSPSVTVA